MNILFNKYKIIKKIGQGGMGSVYLAQNISLGTFWAIKIIEKRRGRGFDLLAEPNMLKKLNHPSLPRIIDIEQDNNYLYIIEDYIEGTPLNKQLEQVGQFAEELVVTWAKQLCEVLLYLHNQKPNPIIYRDMKPANIIIAPDNTVKLVDFGIAREFKTDSLSDTTYMGTRGYAAPEQYGKSQTDERTDIYSLGVTLYHLLTGKNPNDLFYDFRSIKLYNPNLSDGIEYIVERCVKTRPDERYQNVGQLLYDLENIHIFNKQYKKQKKKNTILNVTKIALVFVVISMMAFGGKLLIEKRTSQYEELIDKGNEYLETGNLEEAQTTFEKAGKVKSNDTAYVMGNANVYYEQGNYDFCIEYLVDYANKNKDIINNPDYNFIMGNAYYKQENWTAAIEYFSKTVNLATDDENYSDKLSEYKADLAKAFIKNNQVNQAKQIMNSIPAGNDDYVNFINCEIYEASNDKQSAISGYKDIISTTKNEQIKADCYIAIADIYKEQNDFINEIDILKEAENNLRGGSNLVIKEMLAEAYYKNGNYTMSAKLFNQLLESGYTRSYIYLNIAYAYQQSGDLVSAENILMQMKAKYPSEYRCYVQLAYVYMEYEGNKSENNRNYQKILDNYNLAVQYAPSGENTVEVIQLKGKIDELRSKGWL
ncbi:protein kinase domain-containing protein [Intestinibacter sp.]